MGDFFLADTFLFSLRSHMGHPLRSLLGQKVTKADINLKAYPHDTP